MFDQRYRSNNYTSFTIFFCDKILNMIQKYEIILVALSRGFIYYILQLLVQLVNIFSNSK